MSGFIGSGDLKIDRFDDNGNSQGIKEVGNAIKFAIQEETEIKERISKMRNTYGQVLDASSNKKPAKISITLDDLKTENLAIALLGEDSVYNIAAASISDESVVAIHDAWVRLVNRNVTAASVVVTDDPMTVTYVEDTDYEVDYRLGMIKVLSTGSIVDGDDLLVDYDHGGRSGIKVMGSIKPTVKAMLILDGKNKVTGKGHYVEVYEAVLTPSSEIDFLADDFNTLQLEGTLNTPSGYTGPYYIDMDN